MDRREIAFAAFGCREPAETADRDRSHREPGMRQWRGNQIEPGAMTADDDQIWHPYMRREQRHFSLGTGWHLVG